MQSPDKSSNFEVFWNVPTEACKKYKSVNFQNLQSLYGIKQNKDDKFRGSVITIMYDPGNFPALLEKNGELFRRNGGLPQDGDLQEHLKQYEIHIKQHFPDADYDGLAIIDFESWRPIYRQNFGKLEVYKKLSVQDEKDKHPEWSKKEIDQEVTRKFEEAGQKFVEETIKLSKILRPKAKWGYYAFPYCFNNNGEDFTSEQTMAENDRSNWIFKDADVILPSVYLFESVPVNSRPTLVKGRVNEAMRISRQVGNLPIFVYVRCRYGDSLKLLSEDDMLQVFTQSKTQGAAGIILWGASSDINTEEKAKELNDYVEEIVGPIASLFTKFKVSVEVAQFAR